MVVSGFNVLGLAGAVRRRLGQVWGEPQQRILSSQSNVPILGLCGTAATCGSSIVEQPPSRYHVSFCFRKFFIVSVFLLLPALNALASHSRLSMVNLASHFFIFYCCTCFLHYGDLGTPFYYFPAFNAYLLLSTLLVHAITQNWHLPLSHVKLNCNHLLFSL